MGEPGTPAVGCFVLGGVIPTEPLSFVIPIEPSSLSSRAEVERSDAVVEGSPEVRDCCRSALSGEVGGSFDSARGGPRSG